MIWLFDNYYIPYIIPPVKFGTYLAIINCALTNDFSLEQYPPGCCARRRKMPRADDLKGRQVILCFGNGGGRSLREAQ